MSPDELKHQITFRQSVTPTGHIEIKARLRLESLGRIDPSGFRTVGEEALAFADLKNRLAEDLVRLLYADRRKELAEAALNIIKSDPRSIDADALRKLNEAAQYQPSVPRRLP
jgi:hypothetical protein